MCVISFQEQTANLLDWSWGSKRSNLSYIEWNMCRPHELDTFIVDGVIKPPISKLKKFQDSSEKASGNLILFKNSHLKLEDWFQTKEGWH